MSRIKNKENSVEIKVRKFLFSQGFRYRKNVATLPGKPDIVLTEFNTVIFVNGCFWHRDERCKFTTTPKTRKDYWEAKFNKNQMNDLKNYSRLKELGWNVIIIWECEIKSRFEETLNEVIQQRRENIP